MSFTKDVANNWRYKTAFSDFGILENFGNVYFITIFFQNIFGNFQKFKKPYYMLEETSR